MKQTTRKVIDALLKRKVFETEAWTCQRERDPVQLGDYGYRDTYSQHGKPIFRLEVSFNPPRCRAFIDESV